jgi:hypothetical protein
MVAKGIIVPNTELSDWVVSLVITQKANGKLRLCVDHKKLNRHISHPTHLTRTPRGAVAEIYGVAKFFTSFAADQCPAFTAAPALLPPVRSYDFWFLARFHFMYDVKPLFLCFCLTTSVGLLCRVEMPL